ncbi:MAG: helix-turn-helix transcriptional regulator [Bacteroidia bacterium]
MSIRLFINFLDSDNNLIEKVDFFSLTGKACCDDLELLKKIGETMAVLKPHLLSTNIFIEAKLDDASLALQKLRRKIKYETSVYREKLSMREVEVLRLIMQGQSNKQIAETLFISFETVRTHRKNILKKVGVTNTASLINYYNQAFFDHKD